MRLAVLFSGGKDSTYALFKQLENVVCLISVISKNKESYMFHTPNIEITKLQAKAIGLPLIQEITKGEKEEELKDLKNVIEKAKKEYKIEGIVTGAIASKYQADRIQKICDDLDLRCINPLWQKDQLELLKEVVESGFKFIITQIAAEGFDKSWLGREINEKAIEDLKVLNKKYKINVAFEGGECESLVLDAPFFKKRIEIIKSEIKAKDNTGIFIIKKAKLVDR